MGAIIIGLGVAVTAIGIVLGAIGYGSPETTFGAALITVGGVAVVGGLVLFALGSIHRALVVIAEKLDGVLHFEPDEEGAHQERPHSHNIASDDYPPLPTSYRELEPEPELPIPAPAPAPARPSMNERAAPVAIEPNETREETGGGLPGWFRRKRAAEEAAPEPEVREPAFEVPTPAPAFPTREKPAPAFSADAFEPRTRVRDDFGLEPGAPPAFLRESDLLGDPVEEEPAEPEVTVLKAGTIGGMAYKLYSDGSIEADLPDGTLRFASLNDLREHVANSAAGRGED
ncbi:MAG TPA: hypothetical protein VIQ29_07225 [Ancylobacter sp.]